MLTKRFYRETNMKKTSGTPSLAQENQAIKRQKLDGGLSRQVTVFMYISSSCCKLCVYGF